MTVEPRCCVTTGKYVKRNDDICYILWAQISAVDDALLFLMARSPVLCPTKADRTTTSVSSASMTTGSKIPDFRINEEHDGVCLNVMTLKFFAPVARRKVPASVSHRVHKVDCRFCLY